ncbi:MAG: DUF4870 domain-containing protein, partial [Deltaproteobacteria bacterium]|nr:DUF4870 domain-containing protein [Deltaproteobacteria bacterium]
PAGGILFLLLEKEDAHVRFHAWQSIFFTAVFVILMMAIRLMEMLFGLLAGLLGSAIGDLDWLLFLASGSVLVICLVKAYQGEKWEIPFGLASFSGVGLGACDMSCESLSR